MTRFLTDPPAIAAAAAGTVFTLCAVAVLVKVLRNTARGARPGAARAVQVLALAVTMSYSGLTSWQWATARLHAPVWERALVFAAFEVVMLAFAVASRENRLKDGRSGWQHGATLFFASLMSLMALQVAGSPLVAAVRFGGGPLAALLLFHSLLGLELRHQGTERESLIRAALQEARERLTARLGIGRRGADSAAIARSRAADRAVRLASARRLGSRAAARLADAIDAAQHGLDEDAAAAAEAAIVARVVRRKSVAGLHALDAAHVWSASRTSTATDTPAAQSEAPGEVALPEPAQVPPGKPQQPATAPKAKRPTRRATRAQSSPRTWDQLVHAAFEVNAQVLAETGAPAGVEKLKTEVRVGQVKAQQLRDHLAAYSTALPERGEVALPAQVEHVNGEPVLTV